MSDTYMFRGVDYELGYADFTLSENKTGLSRSLNEKNRKISNQDFTYRIINHWEKNGLISNTRENNKGWRRYSIMDMVWLYIIRELRVFGVSHDLILKVKENLSAEKNDISEFPQLEYYVSLGLVNKPIYLIIFPSGEAHPLSENEYQLNREYSSNNNHVQLNLNNVLQKIFPDKNLNPDFKAEEEPSLDERKIIQMLRIGNYNEINLILEEGYSNKMEEPKFNIKERNIEDIIQHINNKNYKSIDIKQGLDTIISIKK